jgi:hypothetical protein
VHTPSPAGRGDSIGFEVSPASLNGTRYSF